MAIPPTVQPTGVRTSLPLAFFGGAGVGVLGGMIGLGGAEFRLPLLITLFSFAALQAIIVNKALSLVVVTTALPARLVAVPWSTLVPHWSIVVNLLAGSLLGAWVGATWATRMRSATLYRVLAVLLLLIAAALVANHVGTLRQLTLSPALVVIAGVVAGFFIGIVAAIMGVAGGELLIPTIVLLFGTDIKNIQVVGSFHGRLVLTGAAQPGAMHDAKAWRESGLATRFEGRLHADGGPGGFADAAYTGTGLCVPHRRQKGQTPTESTREYNRAIAAHRASIERVISHLKNWRLLATGYRSPLDRFPMYLDAITKLEIYRTS
ncbi:TSUP family transporter [Catellatospora sichuanensis]|uniref:TSUP family transporter n=2 Tax=Catellatospora sichuanensis TaxID=1969805 RepID=UPI001C91B911|nr:TSUP family transporter [Catellatospora sichuanensis]